MNLPVKAVLPPVQQYPVKCETPINYNMGDLMAVYQCWTGEANWLALLSTWLKAWTARSTPVSLIQ